MRLFRCLLALAAGLSAAATSHTVKLVGSGAVPAELAKGSRLRGHGKGVPAILKPRDVTSGGIGIIDPPPVTSGGIGTLNGAKTDLDPDVRRKLQGIKGSLLMRNQVQTLCEVAMVNQRYGFVAASCIDYVDGKVDPSVYYNVKLSQNVDQFLAAIAVETIIPHPKYNPATFENNIAVVMLQTNPLVSFFNPIADWPADWSQLLYAHRTLQDGLLGGWNEPYVMVTNRQTEVSSNDRDCSIASALYAANKDQYMCNTATLTFFANRRCNIPYGVVYSIYNMNAAAAAIYSHSAIYGDGFCGAGKIISYYLHIRNFIKWAESVAGITVGTLHSPNPAGYTASSNPNFSLNAPRGSNPAGVHIFGNFTTNAIRSSIVGSSKPSEPARSSESSEPASRNEEPVSSEPLSSEAEPSPEPVSSSNAPSLPAATSEASVVVSTSVTTSTATATTTITVTASAAGSTAESHDPSVPAVPTPGPNAGGFGTVFNTLLISPVFYTITQTTTATTTATETAPFPGTTLTLSAPPASTVTVSVVSTTTVTATAGAPDVLTVTKTTTVVSTASPESVTASTVTVTQTNVLLYTPTSAAITPVSSTESKSAEPSSEMSSETATDSPSSASPTAIIVGVIALLLLLLLGLLYYLCCYRRKKKAQGLPMRNNRVVRWWFTRNLVGRPGASDSAPPTYVG
ncbi:hypothetical protein H4R19_002348 [Coemansia spiralis]|nr:hypothetical protein H4R19_002348 [Coemansia spiralis]